MILPILMNVFAFLLLAAHFSRAGNPFMIVVSLLLPLLFLIKRRWSIRLLQGCLLAGSIIWILTTIQIVQTRLAAGEDWMRVVVILGILILFTLSAGFVLNSSKFKDKYPSQF